MGGLKNYRPLHDYVLALRDDREAVAGSVLLPEICRDKGRTATIVATGPGRRQSTGRSPTSVAVGDRIWAPLHAGIDVRLFGTVYWQLRDSEIGGILVDNEQMAETQQGRPLRAVRSS